MFIIIIVVVVVVVVVVAVFVIITFFFENKGKIANSFSQSYMGIRYILPTLYCLVLYWSLSEVLSYPLNIKRTEWGWNCLPKFWKDLTLRNLTHECLRVVSYGIFPSLLTFMLTPRDRTKKDLGN